MRYAITEGCDEMITTVSKRISLYLLANDVITAEEAEVCQYGLEIMLSTLLGTMIVLLIGALLGVFCLSIFYCAVFVLLRQLTGGYHADTYFKCNLFSGLLSFAVLGLTRILSTYGLYSWGLHLLLILFSVLTIAAYAPLDNPNKTLNRSQKTRNRILSIVSSLLLSAVSCILFNTHPAVTILTGLTLFLTTLLLLIGKIKRKENES